VIKDEEDICALFECLFPILKAQWETSVTADVELDEVQNIYYRAGFFSSLVVLFLFVDKLIFICYCFNCWELGLFCSSILKC